MGVLTVDVEALLGEEGTTAALPSSSMETRDGEAFGGILLLHFDEPGNSM